MPGKADDFTLHITDEANQIGFIPAMEKTVRGRALPHVRCNSCHWEGEMPFAFPVEQPEDLDAELMAFGLGRQACFSCDALMLVDLDQAR